MDKFYHHVIVFGMWMSNHHNGCRKSLTVPMIGLGAFIFFISVIGFIGALKRSSILLWIVSLITRFLLNMAT
ncbi:hypothetical protein HN51_069468 [Arachis hypogaea]